MNALKDVHPYLHTLFHVMVDCNTGGYAGKPPTGGLCACSCKRPTSHAEGVSFETIDDDVVFVLVCM